MAAAAAAGASRWRQSDPHLLKQLGGRHALLLAGCELLSRQQRLQHAADVRHFRCAPPLRCWPMSAILPCLDGDVSGVGTRGACRARSAFLLSTVRRRHCWDDSQVVTTMWDQAPMRRWPFKAKWSLSAASPQQPAHQAAARDLVTRKNHPLWPAKHLHCTPSLQVPAPGCPGFVHAGSSLLVRPSWLPRLTESRHWG